MSSYVVKDLLDILFDDVQAVINELSAPTGEFTFKQFLQRVTQRHQREYIELLKRCQHRDMPFNAAHQHIGTHLSWIAQKAGFERREEGYVEDIFGNPTKNIVYRRSHQR